MATGAPALFRGSLIAGLAVLVLVVAGAFQAALGTYRPPSELSASGPQSIRVGATIVSAFELTLMNLAPQVDVRLARTGWHLALKFYDDPFKALKDLDDLKVDAALVPLDNAYAVYAGVAGAPFKSTHIRLLAPVFKEVVYVLARPSAGVTSLKALEGKKVAVPPAGTGQMFTVEKVLKLAGVDTGKVRFVHAKLTEGLAKLLDGEVDAAVYPSGWPDPLILGVAEKAKLTLVGMTKEEAQRLRSGAISQMGGVYYVDRLTRADAPFIPEGVEIRVAWTWAVLVSSALVQTEKAQALAQASLQVLVANAKLLPGLSEVKSLEDLQALILAMPLRPHAAVVR